MYNIKALEILKNYLVTRNQTISVAESVTSGHLQAALSLANQATAFFHGGITAYNLGQKARHLSVNPIHALGCNCVSEKVAEEMAINVRRLFSSDWSIGITGYAAPVPE
ncbi:MAG: nicotinamide-nucleotide amidohydrolase family protein [Cyclobacteriaceae bacterium]